MDKSKVKYPGVPYEFATGEELIIPPLSLKTWRLWKDKIQKPGETDEETIIAVTLATLQRNYPDITEDEVLELLDLGNTQEVFALIMDVGGLKRKSLEAETGEAKPGQRKS